MTSVQARALACLVLSSCRNDPVEEDLPSGGFTSGIAGDTFDDLGLDETTDEGVADDNPDVDTMMMDDPAGDDGMLDTSTGTAECDALPDAISHAADIAPIWITSCGFQAGCHSETSPSGALDLVTDPLGTLEAGSHAASGTPLLTAGDPDASYVYLKLRNRQADVMGDGSRMPLSPGVITECELTLIEAWIADGAAP